MAEDLLFEIAEKVATITLNRPKRRNAFSRDMLADWAETLRECQRNDSIGAVVLTGAGKDFCSGGDINDMRWTTDNPALEIKAFLRDTVYPVAEAVEALDKPYIVAVNGAATGAGMDMSLYGDIRFAANSARFAETYIKVGMAAGDGGAFLLPRLVGLTKALELLWSGDFVNANEAERIGLVSKVLPDEELLPYTQAFAQRLANGPIQAVRLMKRAVYQSLRSDLRTALDAVSSHMGVLAGTHDHAEAVESFLEKRAPNFEGR